MTEENKQFFEQLRKIDVPFTECIRIINETSKKNRENLLLLCQLTGYDILECRRMLARHDFDYDAAVKEFRGKTHEEEEWDKIPLYSKHPTEYHSRVTCPCCYKTFCYKISGGGGYSSPSANNGPSDS